MRSSSSSSPTLPRVASFVLGCLALTSTGCFAYRYRAEVPSTHEAALEGVNRMKVESANGRIRVACRPGAEGLRVRAVRYARGETEEEARDHARQVRLELQPDALEPDVFRVTATMPPSLGAYSCGASFDLELPTGIDLEVRSSNGALEVNGARGLVKLRTSNGDVKVSDFDGELETRSSNGRIVLRDVASSAVSAVTSNGDIELRLVRASGLPEVKAHSSNGSIRLEVPPGVGAELSLRTSNGSISRDLDGFRVSGLEGSRRRVNAVLNGGGGHIEAVTSNGSIRFRPSW